MHSPPSKRPRPLAWLAVVAAALLLAWAGLALLVRVVFDPATLAGRLEPRLSAALNRQVELGTVSLALFPRPGVEVTGLRVHNPEAFGDLPLAAADRVTLHPRLLPLLRRQARVDRIRIEEPRLLLLVNEEGVSNFGDFLPESEGEVGSRRPARIDFDLRRIQLRGGRLLYRDASRGRAAVVDGMSGDGSLSRSGGGWAVGWRGSADSAVLRHPLVGERERRLARLGLEAELRAGPEFGWAEIRRGTLRVGPLAVSLAGRVDSLKTPVRRVDVRLASDSVPLADVLAAFAARHGERRWEADGTLSLDLTARGELGPGRRPAFSGTLGLRGGSLRRPGGPAAAGGLQGRAVLGGDSLRIAALRGEALGGALALDGTVWLDSARRFSLRVAARPSLERLLAVRPVEGVRGSGRLDVEVGLGGRLSALAAMRARGRVDLEGIRLELPSLLVPLGVPSGRLELAGEEARWSGLVVELGEDRLATQGTARQLFARFSDPPDVPLLTGRVEGRRLLADRVFPAPPDSIGYGKLVFARLGGRRVGTRTPEEIARERELSRPTSLPARGEIAVRLDTLRWLPYRLADFSAILRFTPELVEVADATFRSFGGRGSGWAAVALGAGAVEPFRLALRVEGARADELLASSTPLEGVLSGLLDLELATDGGLDSLLLPPRPSVEGEGRLGVRDGVLELGPLGAALSSFLGVPELRRLEFSRWEAPFRIEEGALRFSDARLEGRRATWSFSGAVGLGGGLDLGVSARLSPETARAAAAAGGPVAQALRPLLAGNRPLVLGLRVGGNVASPRLALDPSAIERGIREAARQEAERRVSEEVGRRLGAEEGDAARRLLEGGAGAEAGQRVEERLEERAGELLRGLLRREAPGAPRPDTAAARGRDTGGAARRDTGGGPAEVGEGR